MNAEDTQQVRNLVSEGRQSLLMENFARQALVSRLREAKLRELSLATLPAEMAMLAAQQVNEVRLKVLETPKEVGWGDVAFEFVLGFVINSTFMEKLALKIFSRIYARAVVSRQALNATGKRALNQLFETEKQAARQFQHASSELATLEIRANQWKNVVNRQLEVFKRAPEQLPRTAYLELTRDVKRLRSIEADAKVLAEALVKPPQVNAETPRKYAELVADFESGARISANTKNSTAFFKATKDAAKRASSVSASRPLSATDGSSVAIMEHFHAVARAQRMEIEARYAELERVAMSYPLDGDGFEKLFAAFDPRMVLDLEGETLFLDEMASDLRLRLEAMIWMRHLGFSAAKKHPIVHDNASAGSIFEGIDDKMTRYLLSRFGGLVVEYKTGKGGQVDWSRQSERTQARELREYFWAISTKFEQ